MTPSWPDDFAWGVATSSLQSEGAAPASDWASWEAEGRVPPSAAGNGFRTRYADDFRLLAGHGLTHYRLAVDWARIEPRDGRRDLDEVELVREVLGSGRDAGLALWVCLHHLTLPRWFTDDLHGFRDERAGRYRWSAHVDFCADAFGDLVDGWQPIEQPSRYAIEGFLFGRIPPGRSDPADFPDVLATVQRANVDAARLLRGGDAPVISSHWLAPLRPHQDQAEMVVWESWTDPDAIDAFDMIGFVADHTIDVVEPDDDEGPPFVLSADQEPSPTAVTESVADVIDRVSEVAPDVPLVVRATELAVDDDDRRVEHLRAVIDGVAQAIEAGSNVGGYFHWTAVDGYEVDGGFATERGLFDRDRKPKPSAELLRDCQRQLSH
ncbi:MAG: family 1 glycosylhydrolase [Acidimicrobiales bacterium]